MVNRVNKPLVRSKMTITLELKLCPSNFSNEMERQEESYRDTRITLIFTGLVDIFQIPYF